MDEIELEPVKRLSRDIVAAAKTLSDAEARFLVDSYYQMQENRIRGAARTRELDKSKEPHSVLSWLTDQDSTLEGQIKRALQSYAESKTVGQWSLGIYGIGPVISAGLLAHINLEPWRCALVKNGDAKKACSKDEPHGPMCKNEIIYTVGHIWRFAGIDPTLKWEKGQKRPWNASLKTLCWKIGQSFMKFSNAEECYYGYLYKERKALEIQRNEAGEFKEQAALALSAKKFRSETKAKEFYDSGKLPPGHIDARARRYVVKLFLAHWHEVAYIAKYKQKPPLPYPIAILGHAHMISPP